MAKRFVVESRAYRASGSCHAHAWTKVPVNAVICVGTFNLEEGGLVLAFVFISISLRLFDSVNQLTFFVIILSFSQFMITVEEHVRPQQHPEGSRQWDQEEEAYQVHFYKGNGS